MVYCAVFCLEMPDDFPVTELIQFMSAARIVLLEPMNVSVWKEFAGATNLIGWRYRATIENWLIYKYSWATIGCNAGPEDVYKLDIALFSMFGAGVSCVESTTYALAALASHPALLSIQFTEREQLKCSPEKLADWLSNHPTAADLTATLNRLVGSNEWKLWKELRNRMTHRSNLPRINYGAVGCVSPPPKPLHFAATTSTPEIAEDLPAFDSLCDWLTQAVKHLLVEGKNLAS